MSWQRIGGGCLMGDDTPEHLCGDEYENEETGERAMVYSTQERHFDMPEAVDEICELYELEGVKPEWVEDAEAWKR